MRGILMASVLALVAVVRAASTSGAIHIYENAQAVNSILPAYTVDADTARYIIASRLGVDRYHAIDTSALTEGSTLAINRLGRPSRLFEESRDDAPTALILASPNAVLLTTPKFAQISSMPAQEKTEELLAAIHLQKSGQSKNIKSTVASLRSGTADTPDSHIIISSATADLPSEINRLRAMGYTVIVLTSPSAPSRTARYGSYTLPSALTRRQFDEEILEDILETSPSFVSNSTTGSTITASKGKGNSNSSQPLRGILPFCYDSKALCESTTRNCTGHGSCVLAYTQLPSTGQKGTPCYQCSCKASVKGKKSTHWGGPACQKKDVTTPFWLLAGFTVVMMFVVGWAVGLVWSMGEEELPSVIGAGVSGPTAKK